MCVCKPAFVQLYLCGITFFLIALIVICAVFESFYTMLRWSLSREVFLCVFHDLWLSITVLIQTLLVSNNVLIKVTLAQTCTLLTVTARYSGFCGDFSAIHL